MAQQQDQDRSHAATPYKLAKARERGQVMRSPVATSTAAFLAAMVFLDWQGWATWQHQFAVDRALFSGIETIAAHPQALASLLGRLVSDCFWSAAPFLLVIVLTTIVASLAQSGPVLSVEPLKPDWNRLNPADGLKRVLSLRSLFVLARSVLKLVLLSLVAWFALRELVPHFYRLSALPPGALVRQLLDGLASMGLRLGGTLALIALLDIAFSRREFAQKMRMSHRELKDEVKNRDGDPRVRARIRDLRRELLKRSASLRRTSEADVLITNPVHVAVALRYVHGEMVSPQVVAKGRGFMAAVMRGIAARHRIPVVPSPSLARQLYREMAVDQHVRPDLYAPVARIIVWVFSRRDAAARRHGWKKAGTA